MAGMSPTALTLRRLRYAGYTAAVVEHWNPHIKIRQDLFGIIDVLGVSKEGTIAVQATTDSNMSKRVRKITDSDNIGALRDANWTIEVHGWKKKKCDDHRVRWVCRVVDLS